MRLKTEIWVSALLRRCMAQGLYGAVLHKGAAEAGAVCIAINHLDGSYDFLIPPPGPAYDETGDRRFEKAFASPVPWVDIAPMIEKFRRRDSDMWVVEVEDKQGLAGLTAEAAG